LTAPRTLFDYLDLWSLDGTLDRMHHALYVEYCKHGERHTRPTAAIIDSHPFLKKLFADGGYHMLGCG
jgi:hypothetical protein